MEAWLGLAVLIGLSAEPAISDAPVGGKPFTDTHASAFLPIA